MPDRADYVKFTDRKIAENAKVARPRLEIAKHAAVSADHLTGDPKWRAYQEQLQAIFEETEGLQASYDDDLHNPLIINSEEMLAAKIGYCLCQARLNTLTEALELPRSIMEKGEAAREQLEKIGE